MTPESAIELVYQAFRSAAERDIYTGDKLEIIVLTKDGAKKEWRQLRRDWVNGPEFNRWFEFVLIFNI